MALYRTRRGMVKQIGLAVTALAGIAPLVHAAGPATKPAIIVNDSAEPMKSGKFQPTWDSLRQYQTPAWFNKAKFGIWAHWGPQCQPEDGDWYARNMYMEGSGQYKDHLAATAILRSRGSRTSSMNGRPRSSTPIAWSRSTSGPAQQYFFALADHHDNFDLWDSKYQPWNATKIGPEKNLIAGWEKAARANGLKFGVSVHASHAWTWYEPAQGADKKGDKAGVPYDGKLTKEQGKGTWWDGLDPQDLYAQEPSGRHHQQHRQNVGLG